MQFKELVNLRSGTVIEYRGGCYIVVGVGLDLGNCTTEEYLKSIKEKEPFKLTLLNGYSLSTLSLNRTYQLNLTEPDVMKDIGIMETFSIPEEEVDLVLTKIKLLSGIDTNKFTPFSSVAVKGYIDITEYMLFFTREQIKNLYLLNNLDHTRDYRIIAHINGYETKMNDTLYSVDCDFYITWKGYSIQHKKYVLQQIPETVIGKKALFRGEMIKEFKTTPYKEKLKTILDTLVTNYNLDMKLSDKELLEKYDREKALSFMQFSSQNSKDKVREVLFFIESLNLAETYLWYKQIKYKEHVGPLQIKGKDLETIKKAVKKMPVRPLSYKGNIKTYLDGRGYMVYVCIENNLYRPEQY